MARSLVTPMKRILCLVRWRFQGWIGGHPAFISGCDFGYPTFRPAEPRGDLPRREEMVLKCRRCGRESISWDPL